MPPPANFSVDSGSKLNSAWLRLAGLRIPLPRVLSVRVEVTDGFDTATGRQTVAARAANPLLGTVLEYRGSFVWRREP